MNESYDIAEYIFFGPSYENYISSGHPWFPEFDVPVKYVGTYESSSISPVLLTMELSTFLNPMKESKDHFLLRMKNEGKSYKEIREKGNFTESESTLRGRYRSLTKQKEDRVRNPEWQPEDIRLLMIAVERLAPGSGSGKVKIPWMQVADYISQNGGSYHFGNATCHKKWDKVRAASGLH